MSLIEFVDDPKLQAEFTLSAEDIWFARRFYEASPFKDHYDGDEMGVGLEIPFESLGETTIRDLANAARRIRADDYALALAAVAEQLFAGELGSGLSGQQMLDVAARAMLLGAHL